MSIDRERRMAFEAWFRTRFHPALLAAANDKGMYLDPDTQWGWVSFLAGCRAEELIRRAKRRVEGDVS